MSSPKIAMVLPVVLPYFGGTEAATFSLARELDAQSLCKVSIRAFCQRSALERGGGVGRDRAQTVGESDREISVQEYPVLPLPRFHSLSKTLRSSLELISLRLAADLNRSDEEILHFQGAHRPLTLLFLLRLVKGKITVLTTHTLQESATIIRQSRLQSIALPLYSRALRRIDHIIALTKRDEALLVSMGVRKERISIIPNGVDEMRFEQRKDYVRRNGRLKILTVGQFNRNKNFETLIRVVERLSRTIALEAYVVGGMYDREYYDEIRQLVGDKKLEDIVTIGPSIESACLADCYLACDVFVLLSRMETFPLVILEAMHAGLPIVTTGVGANPDLIRDGVNGFLVSPDDTDQICERVSRLLKDATLRREIGRRNKEAARDYTWSRVARATSDLYQRLVDPREPTI